MGMGFLRRFACNKASHFFLDRHLARLQGDAGRLSIPFPGLEVLSAEARKLGVLDPKES